MYLLTSRNNCLFLVTDPQMSLDRDNIPVTVVTTALKQFFSELADPLISKDLCDELMTVLSRLFSIIRLVNTGSFVDFSN